MTSAARPAVYLAGPDVFRADATELGRRKKARCEALGLDGRFPLDDLVLPGALGDRPAPEQARILFEACVDLMDECVAGLVNLTPFRGVSADVGTAVELGYLAAQGKPVVGYTSEVRGYDDRVPADGLLVEPFGGCDNLMVDGAAARAGTPVVRAAATDGDALAAMAAFDRAAAQVARLLGTA